MKNVILAAAAFISLSLSTTTFASTLIVDPANVSVGLIGGGAYGQANNFVTVSVDGLTVYSQGYFGNNNAEAANSEYIILTTIQKQAIKLHKLVKVGRTFIWQDAIRIQK